MGTFTQTTRYTMSNPNEVDEKITALKASLGSKVEEFCKQLKDNHEDDPDCYPLDDDAAIIDDFYQFLIEG